MMFMRDILHARETPERSELRIKLTPKIAVRLSHGDPRAPAVEKPYSYFLIRQAT